MASLKEVLDISLHSGEILLTSGAEIYRVEDTINRICKSYGFLCESFVLPTGIFITVYDESENSETTVLRVKNRDTNLYKIEKLNDFSRSLVKNPVSYKEAKNIINNIGAKNRYPLLIRIFSAGLVAFIYCMLFGGTWAESVAAFFICIVTFTLKELISKLKFFSFFEYLFASFMVSMLSILITQVFKGLDYYRIIIGGVMVFLPGVALVNSIKDALHGDTSSSMARLSEALFVAAALGIGAGIVFAIWKVQV